MASPFADPWIDATAEVEREVQLQAYDANTYVFRQSILTNIEGPFIYLLFGEKRALLLDTGAGGVAIRPHVDSVISQWLRMRKRTSIPLVVAHSHGHSDHTAGDSEFRSRPNTTVVGVSPQEVAAFFGIRSWPDEIVAFDLGGRVLDVIPSPGHEASHVMIFDRRTRLLLSGDTLCPARLYFARREFEAFRSSIDRVVEFTRKRNVSWILGAHIEMTRTPGTDYRNGAATHPNEHVLELPYPRLLELQTSLHKMGNTPALEVHDDFIVYPRL